MKHLFRLILFLAVCLSAWATTRNSDGSLADVNTKIGQSSPGDTVTVPSGTFTWGTSGAHVDVNVSITLKGAGTGSTIINIASGGSNTAGVIRISAAATVEDMAINPSSGVATFGCTTTSGWRITDILYNSADTVGGNSYFAYVEGVYGLIDSNDITAHIGGSNELIFVIGPTNSWQTASSFGTTDAVFIETNTFRGEGYVCDMNANSRGVVRFNTITGKMKIDAHGLCTNTPPRGVRHMEVYDNSFTLDDNGFDANIEIRGGSGFIFDNSTQGTHTYFFLCDYGYIQAPPTSFSSTLYMVPTNYPFGDQVGTGQDTTINATATVAGQMYRIINLGTTNWTAIGAGGSPIVGTQFIATGVGSGSGTCSYSPANAPMYVINNTRLGAAWNHEPKDVAAGAITQYGSTFAESAIILKNRNSFSTSGFDETFTFNGSKGCGRGTKAAMLAITPSAVGVGFWVTNEGTWRSGFFGTSGVLYISTDGATWPAAPQYVPYQYPFTNSGPPAAGGSAATGKTSATGKVSVN